MFQGSTGSLFYKQGGSNETISYMTLPGIYPPHHSQGPIPRDPSPGPIPRTHPQGPIPTNTYLRIHFHECVGNHHLSTTYINRRVGVRGQAPFQSPSCKSSVITSHNIKATQPLLLINFKHRRRIRLLTIRLKRRLRFNSLFRINNRTRRRSFTLLLRSSQATTRRSMHLSLTPLLRRINNILRLRIMIIIINLQARTSLLSRSFRLVNFRLLNLFLLLMRRFLMVNSTTCKQLNLKQSLSRIRFRTINRLRHFTCKWGRQLFSIITRSTRFKDHCLLISTIQVLLFKQTTPMPIINTNYQFQPIVPKIR